jgi:hypothetical protein
MYGRLISGLPIGQVYRSSRAAAAFSAQQEAAWHRL